MCVCVKVPILLMHFICMKELECVWCASCDDELAIGIDLDGSIRHEVFAEQICVDLVCGLPCVDVVPDDLVLIHFDLKNAHLEITDGLAQLVGDCIELDLNNAMHAEIRKDSILECRRDNLFLCCDPKEHESLHPLLEGALLVRLGWDVALDLVIAAHLARVFEITFSDNNEVHWSRKNSRTSSLFRTMLPSKVIVDLPSQRGSLSRHSTMTIFPLGFVSLFHATICTQSMFCDDSRYVMRDNYSSLIRAISGGIGRLLG